MWMGLGWRGRSRVPSKRIREMNPQFSMGGPKGEALVVS